MSNHDMIMSNKGKREMLIRQPTRRDTLNDNPNNPTPFSNYRTIKRRVGNERLRVLSSVYNEAVTF